MSFIPNPVEDTSQLPAFFTKTAQFGDLDLSSAVRETLIKADLTPENIAAYDSHPSIVLSIGKAPDVQLYLQKQFWIYQLCALQDKGNVDTHEDRLLVNRFQDANSWFTYYCNNVLDLVQEFNMPVRHGW